MGLVDLNLQRGASVRVLTPADAFDILSVGQGLVGVAARLAAQHIDQPGARERLSNTLDALGEFDQSSKTAEYASARDSFYTAVTVIAGNALLSRMLPSLQIHLIRVQFREQLRRADRWRHLDYRQIAAAILAGRPALAETAARKHFGRALNALALELRRLKSLHEGVEPS